MYGSATARKCWVVVILCLVINFLVAFCCKVGVVRLRILDPHGSAEECSDVLIRGSLLCSCSVRLSCKKYFPAAARKGFWSFLEQNTRRPNSAECVALQICWSLVLCCLWSIIREKITLYKLYTCFFLQLGKQTSPVFQYDTLSRTYKCCWLHLCVGMKLKMRAMGSLRSFSYSLPATLCLGVHWPNRQHTLITVIIHAVSVHN